MPQPTGDLQSHLQLALSSIRIFGNDGTIDPQELDHLLTIALQDGVVDEEEKRVLASIFSKADDHRLPPRVRQRITEVREKHGI